MRKKPTPYTFAGAASFAAADKPDGPRNFEGVAYSGGVVTDHPWFSRVVFDLSSTTLQTPAPALYRHGEPVGVIAEASIEKDVRIGGRLFSDSDEAARGIASKADAGMPWQLSVGIYPGDVDEIGKGAKVKLNGQTFDGPLTVFRNNRIREVSFVALGADHRTAAQIFEATQQERIEMDEKEKLELEAKLKTETDARIAAEARAKELEDKAAAEAKERRTVAVKELFSSIGREFKPETAEPYLGMTQAQFDAVSADLRKKPSLPENLKGEQATTGAAELKGTESIMAAAREYIQAQAALGVEVSVSDAVTKVVNERQKTAA